MRRRPAGRSRPPGFPFGSLRPNRAADRGRDRAFPRSTRRSAAAPASDFMGRRHQVARHRIHLLKSSGLQLSAGNPRIADQFTARTRCRNSSRACTRNPRSRMAHGYFKVCRQARHGALPRRRRAHARHHCRSTMPGVTGAPRHRGGAAPTLDARQTVRPRRAPPFIPGRTINAAGARDFHQVGPTRRCRWRISRQSMVRAYKFRDDPAL